MLLPSIFGDDFFDNFMENPLRGEARSFGSIGALMQTDVREDENGYMVDIDLPGFKKEDVKASLKDGYMTVTATRSAAEEKKGVKFLRRERYMGTVSRSFYVGEALTEKDIKARFEGGILSFFLPKKEMQKVEEHKYIEIGG